LIWAFNTSEIANAASVFSLAITFAQNQPRTIFKVSENVEDVIRKRILRSSKPPTCQIADFIARIQVQVEECMFEVLCDFIRGISIRHDG